MEEKMPAPPVITERPEENMEGDFSPLPTAAVADVDMEELHRRRTPQELFKVRAEGRKHRHKERKEGGGGYRQE